MTTKMNNMDRCLSLLGQLEILRNLPSCSLLKRGSPQLQYHSCLGTISQVTPQGRHQYANASCCKVGLGLAMQYYAIARIRHPFII